MDATSLDREHRADAVRGFSVPMLAVETALVSPDPPMTPTAQDTLRRAADALEHQAARYKGMVVEQEYLRDAAALRALADHMPIRSITNRQIAERIGESMMWEDDAPGRWVPEQWERFFRQTEEIITSADVADAEREPDWRTNPIAVMAFGRMVWRILVDSLGLDSGKADALAQEVVRCARDGRSTDRGEAILVFTDLLTSLAPPVRPEPGAWPYDYREGDFAELQQAASVLASVNSVLAAKLGGAVRRLSAIYAAVPVPEGNGEAWKFVWRYEDEDYPGRLRLSPVEPLSVPGRPIECWRIEKVSAPYRVLDTRRADAAMQAAPTGGEDV